MTRAFTAPVVLALSCVAALTADLKLDDGTPVELTLKHNLSSETAQPGDRVEMAVFRDVRTSNGIVIPQGTRASGTVVEAEASGRGKNGKLKVSVDYVTGPANEKIILRSTPAPSKTSDDSPGLVMRTAGLAKSPARAFKLWKRGVPVEVAAGARVTAYVHAPSKE